MIYLSVKGAGDLYSRGYRCIFETGTFKNVDIALLPVSGTYVMTADEAVKAALDIKPKIAIPMHTVQ